MAKKLDSLSAGYYAAKGKAVPQTPVTQTVKSGLDDLSAGCYKAKFAEPTFPIPQAPKTTTPQITMPKTTAPAMQMPKPNVAPVVQPPKTAVPQISWSDSTGKIIRKTDTALDKSGNVIEENWWNASPGQAKPSTGFLQKNPNSTAAKKTAQTSVEVKKSAATKRYELEQEEKLKELNQAKYQLENADKDAKPYWQTEVDRLQKSYNEHQARTETSKEKDVEKLGKSILKSMETPGYASKQSNAWVNTLSDTEKETVKGFGKDAKAIGQYAATLGLEKRVQNRFAQKQAEQARTMETSVSAAKASESNDGRLLASQITGNWSYAQAKYSGDIEGVAGTVASNVGFMTDTEKATIQAYAEAGDFKAVSDYYKLIQRQLNAREAQYYERKTVERVASKRGAEAVATGVGTMFAVGAWNVANGIPAAVAVTAGNLRDFATDTYTPIDYNGAAFAAVRAANNLTKGTQIMISNNVGETGAANTALNIMWSAGSSGITNGLQLALGQMMGLQGKALENFTLGTMSASAAGSSAYENLASGQSNSRALLNAAESGLVEYATENLFISDWIEGVGNLDNLANASKKQLVKQLASRMSAEAVEELVGNIADQTWDILYNGEDSAFSQMWHMMVEQDGLSEDEAKKKALQELYVSQSLEAMASAALSVFFMDSIPSAQRKASYGVMGRRIRAGEGMNAQSWYAAAKKIDSIAPQEGGALSALLGSIDAKGGIEKATNRDLGRMAWLTSQGITDLVQQAQATSVDGEQTAATMAVQTAMTNAEARMGSGILLHDADITAIYEALQGTKQLANGETPESVRQMQEQVPVQEAPTQSAAERYQALTANMKPETAQAKADIVDRLMQGDTTLKQGDINKLNLTDASYRALFEELTGADLSDVKQFTVETVSAAVRQAAEAKQEAESAKSEMPDRNSFYEALSKIMPGATAQDMASRYNLYANPNTTITFNGQEMNLQQFLDFVRGDERYQKVRGGDQATTADYAAYFAAAAWNQRDANLTPEDRARMDKETAIYSAAQKAASKERIDSLKQTAARLQDVLNADVGDYTISIETGDEGGFAWNERGYVQNGKDIHFNADVVTTPEMLEYILGHEILHTVDDTLSDEDKANGKKSQRRQLVDHIIEIVQKKNKWTDAQLKEKIERYKTIYQMHEDSIAEKSKKQAVQVDDAYAREELAADLMGEIFRSRDMVGQLARSNMDSVQRTYGILDSIKSKFAKDSELRKAAEKLDKEILAGIEKARTLRNTSEDAVERKSVDTMLESINLVIDRMDNDGGTRRLRVLDKNAREVTEVTEDMVRESRMGALLKASVDKGKITQDKADKQIRFFADFTTQLIRTQDIDMLFAVSGSLGFAPVPDTVFESGQGRDTTNAGFTSNKDPQYKTTVDFTTICLKTQQVIDVMSSTMMKLDHGLTESEIVDIIYRNTHEAGEPVPCPVCYVFARWVGLGGLFDNMARWQDQYADKTNEEIQAVVDELSAKIEKIIKEQPKLVMQEDGTTSEEEMSQGRARTRLKSDSVRKARAIKRDAVKAEQASLKGEMKSIPTESQIAEQAQSEGWTQEEIDARTAELLEQRTAIQQKINKLADQIKSAKAVDKIDVEALNLSARQREELAALDADISILDQWSWLVGVRLKEGYEPVPHDILFDINRGNDFAKDYPDSWRFRTTRGPAMGKAAYPYTAMHLGQIVTGIASGTSDLGEQSKNKVLDSRNGELTKDGLKALDKAAEKVKPQNLMNGQRMQSTSDFRFEYALDYLLAFMDLQALGSKVQLYTKVPEAVGFLASMRAEVNLSLMPLGIGYDPETKELLFSSVTGMNEQDAFGLTKKFDNVQTIMVGTSDEHIRLCMADNRIQFIIPYHASGSSENRYRSMMDTVSESVANRDDYSDYQGDKEITNVSQKVLDTRSARKKILTGADLTEAELNAIAGNHTLRELYKRFKGVDIDGTRQPLDQRFLEPSQRKPGEDVFIDENCYGVKLAASAADIVFPYEYWDKTTTLETADENGRAFAKYCDDLGLHPRFSGWAKGKYNAEKDFTDVSGYWKTLIDRRMYNNDGTYHEQKAVDATNVDASYFTFSGKAESREGFLYPSKLNDTSKTEEIAEKSAQEIAEKRGENYYTVDRKWSLPEHGEKYSYESLVRKDDIVVTNFPVFDVPTKKKKVDVTAVSKDARRGMSVVFNSERGTQRYVHINDIDSDVLVNPKSITHGIKGNITNSGTMLTAEVTYALPEILRNSIAINELSSRSESDGEYSTVLVGLARRSDGKEYIVKSTVNHFGYSKSVVNSVEIYDVLKGIKAKKIEDTLFRAATLDNQRPVSPENVFGTITVADLLNIVKEEYPEFLSRSVRDSMGVIEPEQAKGVRWSLPEDKAYMQAVEDGDTETTKRMVTDAAMAAGYTKRRFHQTNSTFHVFNLGINSHSSGDKQTPYGIFTKATNRDIGLGGVQMELFVKADNTFVVNSRDDIPASMPQAYRDIISTFEAASKQYDQRAEELGDILIDAEVAYQDEHPGADLTIEQIVAHETFDDPSCQEAKSNYEALMNEWKAVEDKAVQDARSYITQWLRDNGYDSMELRIDTGTRGRSTDALIVLDKNQVKSADPVTYDDNGTVIPLSQRFNPNNSDIRFSISPAQAQSANIMISNVTRQARKEGIDLQDFYNSTANINAFQPTADDLLAIADALQPIVEQLQDDSFFRYIDALEQYATGEPTRRYSISPELADMLGEATGYRPPAAPEYLDAEGNELYAYTDPGEIGAANAGFDPFTEAQAKYGNLEPGEKPVRVIDMPAQTADDNRVSQTAQTVSEAAATPEKRLQTIEDVVMDGRLTYIPITNKSTAARAEARVESIGYRQALKEFTDAVNSGHRNADVVALGAVLLNNVGNSDASPEEYADLLVDYSKVLRDSAQATQAARILKTLSPEARLYEAQREVDKVNKKQKEKRDAGETKKQRKAREDAGEAVQESRKKAAKDAAEDIADEIEDQVEETKRRRKPGKKAAENAPDGSNGKPTPKKRKPRTPPITKTGMKMADDFRRNHGIDVTEWMSEVGKRVAKALENQAEGNRKPQSITQIIQADIAKLANQFGPPKAAPGAKRTATDTVRDLIQNRRNYVKAWSQMKESLRQKYQNNPEMLERFEELLQGTLAYNGATDDSVLLSAIAEDALNGDTRSRDIVMRAGMLGDKQVAGRVYNSFAARLSIALSEADQQILRGAAERFVQAQREANKPFDELLGKDIQKTMRELKIKLSDILVQGDSSKEALANRIADLLTQQYGLSTDEALSSAHIVVDAFNVMVAEQSEKRLASMFGGKATKEAKTIRQRFAELANLGAFSDSRWNSYAMVQIFGEQMQDIRIDSALIDRYRKATSDAQREAIMKEIYKDIAGKMKVTNLERFNALRYLGMLGNFKTQVRNVVGNAAFQPVVLAKDAVALALERVLPKDARTKALTFSVEDYKAAAKDFDDFREMVMGGGKYREKSDIAQQIEDERQIFGKTNIEAWNKTGGWLLEKWRLGTNWAMDEGDVFFSRADYAMALAKYLKAQGVTFRTATPEQLTRGRNIAIREAAEATYHDDNQFSNMIAGIGFRNPDTTTKKATNAILQGILPFRKTPANILVRAWEYSPAGLINIAVMGAKSRKADSEITGSDIVNQLAKMLTGSALMALGYMLARKGLLTGKKDDDDKQAAFDELTGYQEYSLHWDGKYYSFDWAAPEAIPMFIGANMAQIFDERGASVANALPSLKTISDPLLSMSMMQGLNDTLDGATTYGGDADALPALVQNSLFSLLTQPVPTLIAQAERASTNTRMTTYVDKNLDTDSKTQRAIGKLSAKVPGWDYNQIPYIDAWGREEFNYQTSWGNALAQFISPWYYSQDNAGATENEIQRLYDATGDNSVLPKRADTSFTLNGETVNLTPAEYVTFATYRGQMAKSGIDELIRTSTYKKMSDADKAKAIGKIYDAARDAAKAQIRDSFEIGKTSANALNAKERFGISTAAYSAASIATGKFESFKDEKGNTVDNSKSLQIMAYIYNDKTLASLREEKLNALAEALGVNKTVRGYKRDKVFTELETMRKKYTRKTK